jgi:ABC-type multidrug transport system fused ATPase/permease subunit
MFVSSILFRCVLFSILDVPFQVVFSYPTRKNHVVLNDVSFTVNPGETVAIVGPSGGGKTSCVKLIERFYVPNGGSITLDGIPLGEYSRRWRHR